MKNLFSILLMSFFLFKNAYAQQLTEGNPCTATCIDATKSQIIGRTPVPNNICPNQWIPCGKNAAECNPAWWTFRPSGNVVTFSFSTSNWKSGFSSENGVYVTLWTGDNCGTISSVDCIKGTSGILTSNVSPCKVYYLQVDGIYESQCDLTINYNPNEIQKSITEKPKILGSNKLCNGSVGKYAASFNSACSNYARWAWTIEPSSAGKITKNNTTKADSITLEITNPPSNNKVKLYMRSVFSSKCGLTSPYDTIEIDVSPSPKVSNNSPICAGSAIVFAALGGDSYSWSGPNNFKSNLQNPIISDAKALDAGTYFVTISNANGCSSVSATEVIITNNPLTSVSVTSNSPICENENLLLASLGGANYKWTGPNGFTSNLQNPNISNVTTSNSGNYSVTISASSGCTTSRTIPVKINPKPKVTANCNTPVCTGTTVYFLSLGGVSYQWGGSNNFQSILQNPIISNVEVKNAGLYNVTITDVNNCKNITSLSLEVKQCVATKDYTQSNIEVFPNPFQENIYIKSDVTISKIEVFDLIGKVLMTAQNINKQNQIINTEKFQSGFYFIKIWLNEDQFEIFNMIKN